MDIKGEVIMKQYLQPILFSITYFWIKWNKKKCYQMELQKIMSASLPLVRQTDSPTHKPM